MVIRAPQLLRVAPIALALALAIVALANESAGGLAIGSDVELGEIIVDSAGNTLYLLLPDAQGESTCYDACADNWPPVLVAGEAGLGEGVSEDLVGSVARSDGTEQVTYGGWPLYTFASDTKAGETNGQGLNDVWFVVAPDGTAVGAPQSDATEPDDAQNNGPDAAEEEGPADNADGATMGDDELFSALMQEGANVFSRICATCHGANGDESLVEHAAILADNSKLENENRVLRRVIHGGGYMPMFGHVLSDREVAAVATYVRNSWGNDYGLIREEAATEAR